MTQETWTTNTPNRTRDNAQGQLLQRLQGNLHAASSSVPWLRGSNKFDSWMFEKKFLEIIVVFRLYGLGHTSHMRVASGANESAEDNLLPIQGVRPD